MSEDVEAAVAHTFHNKWGRIVASLIRITGDLDLAEEIAPGTFARALERYDRDGIHGGRARGSPPPPGTAPLDRMRRAKVRHEAEEEGAGARRRNGTVAGPSNTD